MNSFHTHTLDSTLPPPRSAATGSPCHGIEPLRQIELEEATPDDLIANRRGEARSHPPPKNRNPCGECSRAKVGCVIAVLDPRLCHRCKKRGLTQCPPGRKASTTQPISLQRNDSDSPTSQSRRSLSPIDVRPRVGPYPDIHLRQGRTANPSTANSSSRGRFPEANTVNGRIFGPSADESAIQTGWMASYNQQAQPYPWDHQTTQSQYIGYNQRQLRLPPYEQNHSNASSTEVIPVRFQGGRSPSDEAQQNMTRLGNYPHNW